MILKLRFGISFLSLFFTLFSFSQTTIWEEDFSAYADQTTVGTASRWTLTTTPDVNGADPNDHFWVVSGAMEARDLNGNEQVFQTELINISGFNNVFVKLDAYEAGTQEDSDYINVYYILDGGPETLFASSGSNINDFSDVYSPTIATQSGLSGSTLSIVVRVQNASADEYHYIDNIIIGVPADYDGDGTPNNLDQDGDNDGIPNSEDGCSSTDVENTVGFGNNLTDTTYSLDGTNVTYTHSISEAGGEIIGYTGGNLRGALRMTGDDNTSDTFFNIDATFSTDIEYLTFKMTDFDSDEQVTVNVYDENDVIYDLTTIGVAAIGSFITQTGNTFTGTASNINVDGNNSTEDIYGSVLFYFPGKISRIDLTGRVSDSASLRITEYNYCLNDFDNDGVKDFLDLDSDNDGITDIIEAGGIDSDQNGFADDITDYNNNGIPDIFDEYCTGTTSGIGNADVVVNSNLVTTATNILGPQDLTDAIISPTGSIIVDLTDNVIPNSLIIIKHRKASGTERIPFSIEQSLNPLSGYTNIYNISTSDTNSHFSFSYRVQTNNARYIRITNTDTDQNLGIDYLGYNFGSLTDCNGTIGASIPLLNSDSDPIPNWFDIDSDNDGIPDNIEGQPTIGYILPNYVSNSNGIDTAYLSGFTIQDTDGDGIFDFIDTNSDNDGLDDNAENGILNTYTVNDNDNDGLSDAFETNGINDVTLDVNEDIEDPTDLTTLPDSDGDLFSGGDLDYRDLFDINPPTSATLDFDGVDDYVEVPTSLINNLDQFTLSFWIKPETLPTGNVFDRRFVIGQKDMFEINLSGNNNNPSIYTTHFYGTGPSSGGLGVVINDTNWMHYTVTVNYLLERITVFINGSLIGSTGMGGSRLTNTNPFRIGSNEDTQPSVGNNFEGWIDEVRIFDTILTTDQIQRMVYQEIENNAGNVRGSIIPKDVVDISTNTTIPWTNLIGYYPMSNIQNSRIIDESANNNTATLHNITTLLPQTAPMPFESIADGDWTTEGTWLHGAVWDIEDFEAYFTQPYQTSPESWSIVKIRNDVTTSDSHTQLGMFIDNGKKLTVSGDNEINNTWYLQLDGTIDLQNDSQLIQGINSDLVTSALGKILRRQEGNSNAFWYNYWSSPVGTPVATSLLDNNLNTPFSLDMLKDGNEDAIEFTNAYQEAGKVSTDWLYTFQNGLTYYSWAQITPTTAIAPGMGYTQKGTGNAGTEQQYIFEGKPNNGTILLTADDVSDIEELLVGESEQDVTLTTTLIGNPYPSALDAKQFINDNIAVINGNPPPIQGTILLWEQWAGNTHYLAEYEGGYGFINLLTTERAYQHADIPIASQSQTQGIKRPTFYIPVGQAFFVEVITDTGNIEFNNGQRVFIKESDVLIDQNDPDYADDGSMFFRNSNATARTPNLNTTEQENNTTDEFQILRLEFGVSNGASRSFVLGFSEDATDGFDYGLDGGLITDPPADDMGSILNGQQYVIQAFAPINPSKVVDLTLNASGAYTYTLKSTEITAIDPNQGLYLRDNLTGTYYDLRSTQPYNFTSDAGLFNDRFDVVFQTEAEALGVDEFDVDTIQIYVNSLEDKLFVKGLTSDAKNLNITNMLGQTIATYNNITKQTLENGISVSNLSSGVYMVTINTDQNLTTSKKVIMNR